jgi:hypothetical protein
MTSYQREDPTRKRRLATQIEARLFAVVDQTESGENVLVLFPL